MKHIQLTFVAIFFSIISFGQAPIVGPSRVCVGSCVTLTDATPGGFWSSPLYAALVSVGSGTGIVCGSASGVAVISYTVPGTGTVTHTMTIDAAPSAISGIMPSVCVGSSITLFATPSGGSWTSSMPSVAPISMTGVVTGVAAGVTTITYTLPTGCYLTRAVTVDPLPAAITGPSGVCVGSSITLSCVTPGGSWSSSTGTVGITSTGVATGSFAGTTTISYTTSGGCTATKIVTTHALPASITGPGYVCHSGTTTLICTTGGGTWSSSSGTGTATVGSTTGVVSGITPGSVTITYTVAGTGCLRTSPLTVAPSPTVYTVTGGSGYCAGGSGVTIGLSSSQVAVNYQLHNGAALVGTPIAGTGTAISFGTFTTTGTYTIVATNIASGCTATMSGSATVAVHPLPTVYTITGGGSYCAGGSGVTIGLSSSDAGISYQLLAGSSTAGSPITGTGSAISFGLHTTAGTYTVVATNTTTSCMNTMSGSAMVIVTPSTTPSISVTASPGFVICPGTTVNFSSTVVSAGAAPSYQWTVNAVAVSPAATYTYTPVHGDLVALTVTSSDPCAFPISATSTHTITATPPTITTSSTYPCGGAETITASGGISYSWSPTTGISCSTCSTTDATPTTTTTYTVTGTDATGCSNTSTVTVSADRIAGQISYTGGSSTDVFKVWLIQFNPFDSSITALDSTSSCMISGTTPYYEFLTPAAGNYLVKAKLNGTVAGTSGYIPTYYTSTPNWYAATTIAHTSSRDIANISMVYGTVPSGPGFISGYVASGAGKGTSGDIPEPGMLIYLYNSTGGMITYTYTDAAGNYSFTGLADGTYYVYPEEHKYYTTPSATITLSASSSSASGISFRKSTTFGTIKPYDYTRILATTTIGTIAVYPVPTSRYLYIDWPVTARANTTIVIRDMQGRKVYNASIDPTTANGQSQLDFGQIPDGLYYITISSTDLFYASKLSITR